MLGAGRSAAAQDVEIPRFPFGTRVVVLPVQSTAPLPDGSWPGRAVTEEEALRAMDAELAFALGDRRGSEDWAMPDDLRRALARNPTLDVDPERVAYEGLLVRPDDRHLIYEPLHSQLRMLAALFDTRYMILPITLRIEAVEGAHPAVEEYVAISHQAVLLLAMIDIRASRVIWHGEVRGEPGRVDSGALLATLAQRVARGVVP